jgi:hypothetical protein
MYMYIKITSHWNPLEMAPTSVTHFMAEVSLLSTTYGRSVITFNFHQILLLNWQLCHVFRVFGFGPLVASQELRLKRNLVFEVCWPKGTWLYKVSGQYHQRLKNVPFYVHVQWRQSLTSDLNVLNILVQIRKPVQVPVKIHASN